MANELTKKIIADFYGNNLNHFYISAQDNATLCVEVREGCRIRTAVALTLAKNILAHKRMMLKIAKKAA